MTDKPILFSAPMVRALLDGRKTQTRRIIKPQPVKSGTCELGGGTIDLAEWEIRTRRKTGIPFDVGDRLWVRESITRFDKGTCDQWIWYLAGLNDHDASVHGAWPHVPDGLGPDDQWPKDETGPAGGVAYSVPSIFMPRWASRITLLVTDVRVQRLQNISEFDAWAEGCKPGEPDDYGQPFPAWEPDPSGIGERGWDCARDWYADLWDRINGKGAWDANPWVAAYTFTVAHTNIDRPAAP